MGRGGEEGQAEEEGEGREPGAGLDPGTRRSRLEPKADAKDAECTRSDDARSPQPRQRPCCVAQRAAKALTEAFPLGDTIVPLPNS